MRGTSNKKVLFLLLLSGILISPLVVRADLLSMISNLSGKLVALGAGLATIAFIVSGVMFLTATADPSRMTIAKGSLIAGVVGIVIIILASQACPFINGLLGSPGSCGGSGSGSSGGNSGTSSDKAGDAARYETAHGLPAATSQDQISKEAAALATDMANNPGLYSAPLHEFSVDTNALVPTTVGAAVTQRKNDLMNVK